MFLDTGEITNGIDEFASCSTVIVQWVVLS